MAALKPNLAYRPILFGLHIFLFNGANIFKLVDFWHFEKPGDLVQSRACLSLWQLLPGAGFEVHYNQHNMQDKPFCNSLFETHVMDRPRVGSHHFPSQLASPCANPLPFCPYSGMCPEPEKASLLSSFP